jgi:hypothetical protein
MNDFSDLENELRKLRPAQPSSALVVRVGEALKECGDSAARNIKQKPWRLMEWRRGNVPGARERERANEIRSSRWWSLGFGLAAAAVLILFAVVTVERRQEEQQTVAQRSATSNTQSAPLGTERSTSRSKFVPDGGTNVVYNTRDEGLHFRDGSQRPVRRVRYNTQQTWRWRNPETGASLRVSYPSEEIVLIPVSVQ